jgi:hypothetical protein
MVQTGNTNSAPDSIDDLPGISAAALKGNYFDDYTVDSVTGVNSYEITAVAIPEQASENLKMIVNEGRVSWQGLGQNDSIPAAPAE